MRNVKKSNRDTATAYHEAGHAVAAWRLGLELELATIVPDEDSTGHVKITPEDPTTCDEIGRGDPWHPARLRAEKRVMVLQAGEVAQRRYNSGSVRLYHFREDRKRCFDLLRVYAPDEEKRDVNAHSRLLRTWTVHLIEQHWHLVEAVAQALLENRALLGSEVRDVIHSVDEKQTRSMVQVLLDIVGRIREARRRSEDAHTD